MGEREIPLMREFLAAYRHPRVRLFRRQILDKTVADIHTGRKFQAKAGIKGQSDVFGFISSFGIIYGIGNQIVGRTTHKGPAVPIEIEFKGERTPTSDEQKNWKRFCDEWGVPHFTFRARIGEQVQETVRRWSDELDSIVSRLTAQ